MTLDFRGTASAAALRVEVADGLAVLFPTAGDDLTPMFEHLCDKSTPGAWHGDEPCEGYLVAPFLSAHTITGEPEHATITPSILCPDCGLHGFVTNGVWKPC